MASRKASAAGSGRPDSPRAMPRKSWATESAGFAATADRSSASAAAIWPARSRAWPRSRLSRAAPGVAAGAVAGNASARQTAALLTTSRLGGRPARRRAFPHDARDGAPELAVGIVPPLLRVETADAQGHLLRAHAVALLLVGLRKRVEGGAAGRIEGDCLFELRDRRLRLAPLEEEAAQL